MGSIAKALNHFDKLYPQIYSAELWRSIRLGLLCKSKKMFLINNAYSEKERLINQLKSNGAIDFLNNLSIKEHALNEAEIETCFKDYKLHIGTNLNEFVKCTKYIGESSFYTKNISKSNTNYSSYNEETELIEFLQSDLNDLKKDMLPYESISVPNGLRVMAYPPGVVRHPFAVPHDENGQAGMYPLDGASILTVLLLNPRAGERVLDTCAAPGGKAVALLQTGLLEELVCLDSAHSRVARLRNVLSTHAAPVQLSKVTVLEGDCMERARFMGRQFDKVLVDAPCSADRHAVTKANFSLFSGGNDRRRADLFATQCGLLRSAVECCRIGGDVVYSTCTLSPMQNERVIATVVKEVNRAQANDGAAYRLRVVRCRGEYLLSSPSPSSSRTHWCSTYSEAGTLGQLVLPSIVNNYGPAYVCKIRKVPV